MFDTEKVGLVQPDTQKLARRIRTGHNYTQQGLFILDTSSSSNSNRSHEFSTAYDPKKSIPSVIGAALTDEERKALLEYLKTLYSIGHSK